MIYFHIIHFYFLSKVERHFDLWSTFSGLTPLQGSLLEENLLRVLFHNIFGDQSPHFDLALNASGSKFPNKREIVYHFVI